MKRLLLVLTIALVLLAFLITPLAADTGKAQGLKVGDKIVLAKHIETIYKGKNADGSLNWEATIGVPKYLDDLTTLIDCRWSYQGKDVWTSRDNLYSAKVKGTEVTVDYNGKKLSWQPDIYIGKDKQTPVFDSASLLLDDPINENYHGNTLQWEYTGFTRNLRIIEGALLEYYTIDKMPLDSIRIVPNTAKDADYNWLSPCGAYGADFRPVPLQIDDAGTITLTVDNMTSAVFPITIDPTSNFDVTSDDGWLDGGEDSNWSDLRTQSAAVGKYVSGISLHISTDYFDGYYYIQRGFVYFDTSALPDSCAIGTALLYVRLSAVWSESDARLYIVQGMPTYPSVPLSIWDYYYGNYENFAASYGYCMDEDLSTSLLKYVNVYESTLLKTIVNKTGLTKLCLIERRDKQDAEPSSETQNNFLIHSYEKGAGYRPYLKVTYTALLPTITTSDASAVTNTTATLNGDVVDTGGEDPTVTVYWGDNDGGQVAGSWDNSSVPTSPGQPQGVAAFYKNVTGLTADTPYYFSAKATNSGGTSWGTTKSFTTLDVPAITTDAASNVAKTSARLNSAITSDGGSDVTVRFGWGVTSNATIEEYDNYDTLGDTYNTGEHPYLDVGSLTGNTTYYFRVEGTNDYGATLGTELTFNTTSAISDPTNLKAFPQSTSVSLTWDAADGASQYLLRYGVGDYPDAVNIGTEVYLGASTSTTHSGLTPGDTYYYSVWGESGGAYSTGYNMTMITTSAGEAAGAGFETPGTPSRWISAPDYTNLSNLLILYPAVNDVADSLGMPRETLWMLLALLLSVTFGILIYIVSHYKVMVGTIALILALGFGWAIKIVPFWIPLMAIILVVGLKFSHREVES